MSSGVGVNPDCIKTYQEEFKMGKKLKYIIFGLSPDNKEIVVMKKSDSQSYDDFIGDLPAQDCRWAVYDFEFDLEDGGRRNKICFYSWSPDDAKVKSKMIYASSKEALRRSLVGIATEIQGTAIDEVAYEIVLDKVTRGT